MDHLASKHPVERACGVLNYSKSSYYFKRKQIGIDRDRELKNKIREIFDENRGRYGSPRITRELWAIGVQVSENKVANLMNEMGLRAAVKRKFRPTTTINDPKSNKSPRVFQIENNKVETINQIWCSDLTYLDFQNHFLYLVVYLDVYSRRIKSWELSTNMKSYHTKEAFLKAVKNTPGKISGTIVHSDRGVQYCEKNYRETVAFLGITQSMSRSGNCYDNAFAESFFASLKKELSWKHCKSAYEVKKEIADYINWYNTKRRHSSLGYISPEEFEKKQKALSA